MVRRPLWQLFSAGALMILWNVLAVVSFYFLIPGTVLAVIGVYLIVWAIFGKGYWCRNCKRFDTF
jgi:MFS superfamily sulfate permease-like transporter